MAGFKKLLKQWFLFHEPKKIEQFILQETPAEKESADREKLSAKKRSEPSEKKPEGSIMSKLLGTKQEKPQKQDKQEGQDKESEKEQKNRIKKSLSENLAFVKEVYHIPTNGDIMIREFDITARDRVVPAFIVFIDGMTDRKVINDDILLPLMVLSNLDIKSDEKDTAKFVRSRLIAHNQLKEVTEFDKVFSEVDFGGCGIFVDGADSAFTADVKGWEHRMVERPNTELLIRGPQEGFNEILRVNTALIRKRLKDVNLICENVEIGEKSKTPCSMMYINNIVNDSLVDEVRRRLKSIRVDYLHDSGELEQLIEDSTFNTSPQVIATERPDRVAASLTEGKVAVVVHGSPFVLIMPTTAIELTHSPEDMYLKFPFGSFLRGVRLIGIFISLLLPALYLAITNYHQEMIPTSLLLAIEAAREKVPFPSVVEILIMEFSFELIREAGIRIPGPIGPTLGIIGALILGQAAVAANIVSPVLIIIVAVTGIGSFAVPNFSLALSFRILRFIYIFLAATMGFIGISVGLFIHGILLMKAKSFGVPFLIPFGPKTKDSISQFFFRYPIWQQEKRMDYLNTKASQKQPEISRGWKKGTEGRKDGE